MSKNKPNPKTQKEIFDKNAPPDDTATAGPTTDGPPGGDGGDAPAPLRGLVAVVTRDIDWQVGKDKLRLKKGDYVTTDDIPDLSERLKAGKDPLEICNEPE